MKIVTGVTSRSFAGYTFNKAYNSCGGNIKTAISLLKELLKLVDGKKITLVPFYSENAGKKNSYTVSVDINNNKVYRYEEQNIKMSLFLPVFILFFISVRLFPIELIPLNNFISFSVISILIYIIGLYFGNIVRAKGITNIREFTLNQEEWKYYQRKAAHFYPRQLILALLMLIIPIVCFVYLYIYPSKFWLFGGVLSSFVAGTLLIFLSKTRYLIYKDKLDVKLQKEKHLNEDITNS